jgi:hypothetical protein
MQTAKSRAGSMFGDLHVAPGPVRVEKHKQIGRTIAPIFAIVTFGLTWLRRDRLAHFANQLSRTFVEANHRMLWIGLFGVEIENVLHTRDISTVHLRNAPHVPAPRLQVILA